VAPRSITLDQLYWSLRLSDHAINLAVAPAYNRIQLQAIPLSAAGTALAGAGPVTYQALDSSVTVDSTGVVTARSVTSSGKFVPVTASLQIGNVTHADTAFVQVTDTVPQYPLVSFSIQPQSPAGIDSTKSAAGSARLTIPLYATDAAGNMLCGVTRFMINANTGRKILTLSCKLVVAWSSSDPSVATIDNKGKITPRAPGHVTFTATTNAYGVIMQDTLAFVIGYPTTGSIIHIESMTPAVSLTPVLFFSPATQVIGVGGQMRFANSLPDTIDVVFDDSTAVLGAFGSPNGNIAALTNVTVDGAGVPGSTFRVFPIPGTYTYHSRRYGTGGTIIVSDGTVIAADHSRDP
jgi:hypothetical protein